MDLGDDGQWGSRWHEILPEHYPPQWLKNGQLYFANAHVAGAIRDAFRRAPDHKELLMTEVACVLETFNHRVLPPDDIAEQVTQGLRRVLISTGVLSEFPPPQPRQVPARRRPKTPAASSSTERLHGDTDATVADAPLDAIPYNQEEAIAANADDGQNGNGHGQMEARDTRLQDCIPEDCIREFSQQQQKEYLMCIAINVLEERFRVGDVYMGCLRDTVWRVLAPKMRSHEMLDQSDVRSARRALRERVDRILSNIKRIVRKPTDQCHSVKGSAGFQERRIAARKEKTA